MKKITNIRKRRVITAVLGALVLFAAAFLLMDKSLFGNDAEAKPNPKSLNSYVERPNVPAATDEKAASKKARKDSLKAPKNDALTLTVPKMKRVDGVKVFDAPASDNNTLDKGAMHIKGTGYPWQKGANVFIAGHRLGYKNTGSYLLFRDLDALNKGDEMILTDAEGRQYTYRFFKKFTVHPDAVEVMRPGKNRNIISLQSCTLPDYKSRLIVQGELETIKLKDK